MLTLVNFIANGGLIAILIKNKDIQEDSSTPLLLALNITDFVHGATFGMISLILSWMGHRDETIPNLVKQFHIFSMRFTRFASLNLVAALAVVKLITIVKPLRAVQLITKTMIRLMLITSYILPLPAAISVAFETLQYSYKSKETSGVKANKALCAFVTALVVISLTIYTVSYVYIFICVVRQVIKMRRLVHIEGIAKAAAPNPVIEALKTSKGIMAVLTIYVVIYVPGLILAHIYSDSDAYFGLYWLAYAFGSLNVFAYVSFSKHARKELRNFLYWVKGRNGKVNIEIKTIS